MMPARANEPAAPEKPQRRFRKLRIAWSVGWGLACVLLIIFWWRSWQQGEGRILEWSSKHRFAIMSLLGEVGIAYIGNGNYVGIVPSAKLDWEESPHYPYSVINRGPYPHLTERGPPFKARFRWTKPKWYPDKRYIGAPYWFLTVTVAALGAVPWIQPSRRFSLRTMLIATAVVAVTLGLIAYAGRK
jgi:hypothetical protein